MGNSIKERLCAFITDTFLFGDTSKTLGDEESFLEKGIIDSTGVVHLVSFVEEVFGITVNDEEILPENFDTISRLTRFVQKKSGVVTGTT
ncbi:MAG: acyl carrier protein [Candidatus Manganitrophaceae bacterium]